MPNLKAFDFIDKLCMPLKIMLRLHTLYSSLVGVIRFGSVRQIHPLRMRKISVLIRDHYVGTHVKNTKDWKMNTWCVTSWRSELEDKNKTGWYGVCLIYLGNVFMLINGVVHRWPVNLVFILVNICTRRLRTYC